MRLRNTLVSIAAILLATASSVAQADALNGIYVGAGIGLYRGAVEVEEGGDRLTLGAVEHEPGINFNVGFGRTFGQFYVAVEGGYHNGVGKSETVLGGETLTAELKDALSISVLPGFMLSNNTVAFARIGYARVEGEFSFGGESDSEKFSGLLWGLGVKHAFTRNVAGVLEYQSFSPSGKDVEGTNFKPASSGVVLGVQIGF